MAAVDLPIEELRQPLAQIPLQGQGAVGLETVYRNLIGFVPPCADARDDEALESKLLRGARRLALLLHGQSGPTAVTSFWRHSPNASVRTGSPAPWRPTADTMQPPCKMTEAFRWS